MSGEHSLEGSVALVIGGSSESGPPVCEALVKNGARLAFTYHSSRENAEKVARNCRELASEESVADPIELDIADTGRLRSAVSRVTEAFGRLDILVNLGGPPPVFTDIRDVTEDEFDAMMSSHFKGYFFLSREAAAAMEPSGGLIVNVSATSSMKYDHSVYGLAKAAVNAMCPYLAYALAPHVRCVTLVPGLIDLEEIPRETRDTRRAGSPLQRLVTPQDLGETVVALASTPFLSVTGQSIVLDGGFWLRHA